jgi:hypothetical protein
VTVTSSPMRTDSPIRRVKIKIGRPSLFALPSGRVCQTRPAGTPNPAYAGLKNRATYQALRFPLLQRPNYGEQQTSA